MIISWQSQQNFPKRNNSQKSWFEKPSPSSSHITSFNCSRFVVDGGNPLLKFKHPFMWSSFKLHNSPMSFGKCLMHRQLDRSRMHNLWKLLIDSGYSDKSVQDPSLNTSKFTNFPIPLGSADSWWQLVMLSFLRQITSHNTAGNSTRSLQ